MNDELTTLRGKLDVIDDEIIHLLARRMEIIKKVGAYKKANGIAPLQPKRWQAVLQSRFAMAKSFNLSETFIEKLFNTIHEYALKLEKEIR